MGQGTGRRLTAALATLGVLSLLLGSARGATTTRVSVSTGGAQGNNESSTPSTSSYGRFVAFASDADNLVAGDTNGKMDVFVRDYVTSPAPQTIRVSVASDGTQADSHCADPSISVDGQFVAFVSRATNLVPGGAGGGCHVYVHNRLTGETSLVSVASDGTPGNADSSEPSISGDGQFVAFTSQATNLAPGGASSWPDVFVHNTQSGQTTCISITFSGADGNGLSGSPAISADGRFVAFVSSSSNLVADDTNTCLDVFVRDRQGGATTRVSVRAGGVEANWDSDAPSISGDGRFVAFESKATNLVADDTNGHDDVFVHDVPAGQTALVSVASDGTQGDYHSSAPSISADGWFVAFVSGAKNLIEIDTNWSDDVFVRNRQTDETTRVSVASDGTEANWESARPSISADGGHVAFETAADNLVAGDTNLATDVFVHERGLITPAPPTGVAASDGPFADKVWVTWSPSNGAASYAVWRHTSNNSASATQIAASLTSTTYDDTTAAAGTIYWYWVRATNAAGTSAFSTPDTGFRSASGTCVDARNTSGIEDGTPGHPYRTIQQGILNAADGGTVKVARATYNESLTVTGKSVTIQGGYVGAASYPATGNFNDAARDPNPATNGTVIDGGASPVVCQGGSGAGPLLSGFTLRNHGAILRHCVRLRQVVLRF